MRALVFRLGAVTGALGLLMVSTPFCAPAQELKPRPVSGPEITLDMVIEGSSPNALTPQDVLLTDEGKTVSPAALAAAAAPVRLVFVLDAINGSLDETVRSERALLGFLQAAGVHLPQPASVIVLSDAAGSPAAGQTTALHHRDLFVDRVPESQDTASLLHGLKEYESSLLRVRDGGTTDAEDRVRLSLEGLSFLADAERAVPGAKIVIWLSPGWPLLNEKGGRSQQSAFDSIVYVSGLLQESRMILYQVNPVGVTAQDQAQDAVPGALRPGFGVNSGSITAREPSGDSYYQEFLRPARNPRETSLNALSLQVLATQSGGRVMPRSNGLQAQIAQCAADASRVFSVVYAPGVAGSGLQFHQLQAKVRNGARVRLRAGFYSRCPGTVWLSDAGAS